MPATFVPEHVEAFRKALNVCFFHNSLTSHFLSGTHWGSHKWPTETVCVRNARRGGPQADLVELSGMRVLQYEF